jgi:hypothetical protein
MSTKPMSPEVKARLAANRKAKRAARKAALQQTGDGWTASPPRFVPPDRVCASCGGLVDERTIAVVEGVARVRRACLACGKITVALAEAGS